MHIAIFSPSWPPGKSTNGIVTYVAQIKDEFAIRGHRVSLLVGQVVDGQATSGIHVVEPAFLTRVQRWAKTKVGFASDFVDSYAKDIAAVLARINEAEPVDVLEMEESFGWAAEVARRTRIPTVVKLHGPAFMSLVDEELKSPSAIARIAQEGIALALARVVTSPARRTLDETIARYCLSPPICRHIVNPLTLPQSAPLWNLDACQPKTLLFVGRFDKRKGGDIVLRAFRQLLEAEPDLLLTFVGPDAGVVGAEGRPIHFEEMRAALFTAEMSKRILFRGKLSPTEIYALRARAFAIIIASRWENQGYTALEAMLQGCPVVSSDAGGQGELIEHGISGLLAKTGSAEDLAAKIKMLLDDPEWAASLGRRAREYVLHTHSPATVVTQTLAVYAEAIADARARKAS